MKKVFAAGELLVDFMGTKRDVSLAVCDTFIKKAGGAPPNALAALCKLGGSGYLFSKVGDDPFGEFLIQQCKNNMIDVSMVQKDKEHFTTCAFVSLTDTGERDFVFAQGAHKYIDFESIDMNILEQCEIFHFGAATGLIDELPYKTYISLLDYARDNSKFVVFDPNYRYDFWKENTNIFIQRSKDFLRCSNVVKASEQEILLLSGEKDIYAAAKQVNDSGADIVLVTLGEKGSLVSTKEYRTLIPSIKVDCIDSTGAGDAFIGAFLFILSNLSDLSCIFTDRTLLEKAVSFANKAGAICCKSLGAMESMPSKEQINLDMTFIN